MYKKYTITLESSQDLEDLKYDLEALLSDIYYWEVKEEKERKRRKGGEG